MDLNKEIPYYIVVFFFALFFGTLLYIFNLGFTSNLKKIFRKEHPVLWQKVSASIEDIKLISVKDDELPLDLQEVFLRDRIKIRYNYYYKGKRYVNDSIGFKKSIFNDDESHVEAYKKLRNRDNVYVWVNPKHPSKSAIIFDFYYHLSYLLLWIGAILFLVFILLDKLVKKPSNALIR